MNERGVFREEGNEAEEKSDFEVFEERARGAFDRVVKEIRAEYEEKSSFEQRVMFELIIPMMEEDYKPGAHYLRDLWNFRIGISDEQIRNRINDVFNKETNCGGYALEIACPIFSNTYSLEEAKENILESFPFVREYDWEELGPDEYLVLYRHETGGCGHHFVKYADGEFTDKCGCGPIKKFERWPEYYEEWSDEAYFVVSRDHDMIVRDEDGERVWSIMV